MFIPKIYAKAALQVDQIESKLSIGCDGIEIQLLTELVNGKLGDYKFANEVFDLDTLLKYNITAVHAPLLGAYGLEDVNLESLCDAGDFKLLDQVCYIANKVGEMHNRKTIVIIHSETSVDAMMLIGDTWKRVLNSVGCILFKYPNIEIAIENVTPMNKVSVGNFILSNNFVDNNVKMVSELRKQLKTDRIGTVLDTCHAEITKMFYDTLYAKFSDVLPKLDLSMDYYFRTNRDYCKLFHMSETIGTGYGKGRHGMPFQSLDVVTNYMDLYYKYEYNCPITLEVAETDFIKSDGYEQALHYMRIYLNEREPSIKC